MCPDKRSEEEGREAWVGAVGKGVMAAWDLASPVWTEGGRVERKTAWRVRL